MKRGQAALEYLLTYGWAILIVIIVGASLYALGVFTPGQWTGKRATGFAYFRVEDFSLDDGGNLEIYFQNQIGKTVELNDINATLKNEVCDFEYVDADISPQSPEPASAHCFDVDFRSSYSIIVDFYYTDPDSGLEHIDSGTLHGSVEK
jgi:hypothetical protein